MNVLLTCSRMPFALDLIRKFGKAGHNVYVVDTFKTAPGSHSKYVKEATLVPSPRYETDAFLDTMVEIVHTKQIDLLVPCFEDAFYIAKHIERFENLTDVFVAPFEKLVLLHDKASFLRMCQRLSVPTPQTTIVSSQQALAEATQHFNGFFARAAYSRGGVTLYTNRGPLAGVVKLDQCHPSLKNPWLVQEFVDGEDYCTFGVARNGHLSVHSTYVHPKMIEHAGGIVFESVNEPEILKIVTKIVRYTRYTGHIAFDFKRTKDGRFVVIECNPRPTAGAFVVSPESYIEGFFDHRPSAPRVAAAGIRRKYSVALLRDMALRWREIPSGFRYLVTGGTEVYAEPGDRMPGLYQFLSYSHVRTYRREHNGGKRGHNDLMAAYFYDYCWNGQPISSDVLPAPTPSKLATSLA